jgi:hypothetical protein
MIEAKEQITDMTTAFEKGMAFHEYAADLRVHREAFMEHYARVAEIFARLPCPPLPADLTILVITEDWCPDSVFNVPIVARLAHASGIERLRILRRLDCRPLADAFRGRGAVNRVPTLVFIDAAGRVVGHWSERCASSQRWFDAFIEEHPMPAFELVDGLPAPSLLAWMSLRISSEINRFYDGAWRDVVEEILAIANRGG